MELPQDSFVELGFAYTIIMYRKFYVSGTIILMYMCQQLYSFLHQLHYGLNAVLPVKKLHMILYKTEHPEL